MMHQSILFIVKVYDSIEDNPVYTGASDFNDAADQAVEYTYDANGNTISDANKGITSIEYNALNLPAKITFTDGSRMENTYSADGTLLRRYTNVSVTHTPPILHAFSGGIVTQLPHVIEASDDHIGPLTYHNGVLERIDTPNGFIDGDGEIYYYVKDYQGNIRQVTDADGTVLQDNHYYPYGMLMAESSDILAANRRSVPPILSPSSPATVAVSNPYLYGGKEYLTFKGANYLDFSARIYDNTTLTFGSPDPLRDNYTDIHAHLYCAGNPVMFIDPTGMKHYYNQKGQYIYSDDDDCDDKYLVLTDSKDQNVVKDAVSNQHLIPVPSDEIIAKFEQIYKNTQSENKEYGFYVSSNGKVNETVVGDATSVNPYKDRSSSKDPETPQYDVHSHPVENGIYENNKEGYPDNTTPSPEDLKFDTIYPSIILGFKASSPIYEPNTIGGKPKYDYYRTIGFYNKSGLVGKQMTYTKFLQIIKNIRKHNI